MKIGDKVQVIGNSNWRGEIIEITDIIDNYLYPYKCIDSKEMECLFKKEDLKLIKTNMKKSDLKTGMLIKFENGDIGLLVNEIIIYSNGEFDFLRDLSISEVSKVTKVLNNYSLNIENWTEETINENILFNYEEVNELTVEQVEELTGLKNVKIIK